MKRSLVTGGAGFLGSHLCDHLILAGHDVFCLDNYQTGSCENIAHLLDHPRFELIEQDVTSPISLEIDEIYNLACPASPLHYQSDPVKTLKTNVLGAINMLELARTTGARLLQASTSEVYGDPGVHPQPEEYWGNVNPIGVRSCYDEGKRCAESLFFNYHRQYGVDIRVVRIFNTYGPRMASDDGRVVSNFLIQALRGEDLTVYGDGSQTRSFCFVDDIIDGLILSMKSERADSVGPLNIGNSSEYTIKELAETVLRFVDSSSRIEHHPLPVDDPQVRKPDLTKVKSTLGWEPKVPLEDGLKRTIAYFIDKEQND